MRAALFFLFLLTACSKPEEISVLEGEAFTINYKVVVGKTLTLKEKKQAQQAIDATFAHIDAVYNNWNPHSEIGVINSTTNATTFPLSEALSHFLHQVDALVTLSEGRFDPTIAPLLPAWKQALKKGELLDTNTLKQAVSHIGWEKVQLTHDTLHISHPLLQLDLCALSKGYAVDLLVENLHRLGHEDVLVEWGGEMKSLGQHPQGRPWQIGILGLQATLELNDQAIATSGDYNQFWKVQGKTYTHIVHPQTLYPLLVTPQSISSTTVVARSCMLADALATTLMLFENLNEAKTWIKRVKKEYPEILVWVKTSSGEVLDPSAFSLRALE